MTESLQKESANAIENRALRLAVVQNLKAAGLTLSDIKHVLHTAKFIPFFDFKGQRVDLRRVK